MANEQTNKKWKGTQRPTDKVADGQNYNNLNDKIKQYWIITENFKKPMNSY